MLSWWCSIVGSTGPSCHWETAQKGPAAATVGDEGITDEGITDGDTLSKLHIYICISGCLGGFPWGCKGFYVTLVTKVFTKVIYCQFIWPGQL